ncbi:hypothetical protein ACJQWK_08766 [Exserohilum turcicum]|uniref:Uncharacterized protein n=1 Tax=Exserohilum turcicum (strain 28A) TaxID=671987 RepID=R0KE42_EXST2|nr:uncharacterized protein SETTUDRAFT_39370 [Exserohilum turcica Et28A]EOA87584.1 hypothetical protein SETTUDRAFT_39370 [Exserohilum turcica Et28A]
MNALDFLIDFATLIGTSSQSKTHQDENTSVLIDSGRYLEAESVAQIPHSALEQYHFIDKTPRETTDTSLPQPSFPASHWPDQHAFEYELDGSPSFPVQHDNHIWQDFNRHVQQDCSSGLPYELVPVTQYGWSQQTEDFQPWSMFYDDSYTQSPAPDVWYYPWTDHFFQPTQHPDTRYAPISEENLSSQLPCNESVCRCQHLNSQSHYQTEDMQQYWDIAEAPLASETMHTYSNWALQLPEPLLPTQDSKILMEN